MKIGNNLIIVGGLAAVALVSTTILSVPESAAAEGCTTYFDKSNTSQHTVLLSDGNAWDLLQRYFDEAGKRSLKVDPWKVKVVLVADKQRKEFSLNWIQMLTGAGAKEKWASLLKKVSAEADEKAFKEAVRQKWDIICYPATTPAPLSPPPTGTKDGSGTPSVEAKQHFHQGMQYAARRDFSNACKEFSNAISVAPGYAAAYSNRGVAYMQQKKFDLAEDDLKKAIQLGPKDGNNHYNLACWYSQQHQIGRGLTSIDAALANGFTDYNALRKDKDLTNLRKSPEWQKTLEKHKIFLGGGK